MSDPFDNEQVENEPEEVVPAPRKKQPKMITVYGARKQERDRVAFFEVNDFHPDGEAYVVNDGQPVQVAETPAVKRALAEQRLTTEKVSWASLINTPKRGSSLGRAAAAPPLREATKAEEEAAKLQTPTEHQTAQVPQTEGVLRRGGRPGGK